jgi:hypothetical protein
MKMKYRLQGLFVGLLLSILVIGAPTFAEDVLKVVANPFPIYVDGSQENIEALNINGFTFLKLGDFGKVGLVVKFNETERKIEVTTLKTNTESEVKMPENIVNTPSGGTNQETVGTDGGSTTTTNTATTETTTTDTSNGDPNNIVLPSEDDDRGTILGDQQPK